MTLAPRTALGQSAVWQPQGATTGNIYYNNGNVGIQTATPQSLLDVGGVSLFPIITSNSFKTGGGTLGSAAGSEMVLANFAFASGNATSLSMRARRVVTGADWTSASLGITGDVDVTAYAAGQLWLSRGNVGIGTPNPLRNLHVYGPAGLPEILLESSYNAGSLGRMWGFLLDNTSGRLSFRSSNSTVTSTKTVITLDPNGGVGIGTSNPQYALAVKGTIGAQEIVVTQTASWPDYVFRPGYRLKPLSEISAYIQRNHHLPGIPSEAEVQKEGVSVGEMQAKLLAKIEELTLHMIDAERRNQMLQERITRLEAQSGEKRR